MTIEKDFTKKTLHQKKIRIKKDKIGWIPM
jgi:hypothetical protein